jgi:hypothetical protein
VKSYKYILALSVFLCTQTAQAGWDDFLKDIKQAVKGESGDKVTTSLSEETVVRGLKEALNQGIDKSVRQLGRPGGFLSDATVKIPMPDKLQKVEKGLRKVGQDKVADKFIYTMNDAAEKAVPGTVDILVQAVKDMTLKDAVNILQGPPDAATQYFKQNSSGKLRTLIKPIVQNTTSSVGVTDAYKKMISKAGFLARYLDKDSLDVDQYITDKAIDGLFVKIALEEKHIREDPVARTTDILKEVFGY